MAPVRIKKNLYFMGFMATGKTQIGRLTARMVGWPFADTDTLIEMRAGKTIAQIFAESGEAGFRQIEQAIITEISQQQHWVVALGGGAILNEKNWQLISQTGITICLTASIDTLCERIARNKNRPLLANAPPGKLQQTIQNMLAIRAPFYQKADFTFENRNDLEPAELAQQILVRIGLA